MCPPNGSNGSAPTRGEGVAARYARHTLIEGFSQQAMAATRVAVIGAGAIGNEVVKNLALLGVGAIDLFDFDIVEAHNLTRSVLLRETDIGAPKALAVARRAAELDPGIRVRGFVADLRTAFGPLAMRRYHLMICAVDNFEARIRASQVCRLAGRPLVTAAIDHRYASVEHFPFGRVAESACYECHLAPGAYERIARRYSCGGLRRALLAERRIATTTITASLAGAQAVSMALFPETLHHPQPAMRQASRLFADSRGGVASLTRLTRQPHCPGCGGAAARATVIDAGGEEDGPGGDARGGVGGMNARLRALFDRHGVGPDAVIASSDALIVERRCMACGALDLERVGQRAADHDDRLMRCERCQAQAVRIEIRERFDAREWLEIGPPGPEVGPMWLAVEGRDLVFDLGSRRCPAAEPGQ